MNFTLIGMSNIGKSNLAQRMVNEKPFRLIDCDARIIDRLDLLGLTSLTQLARWLGQPDTPQYTQNAQKYMDAEQQVMDEIVNDLDRTANLIIDTSGSVIYIEDKTRSLLRERSRILHLEPPSDHVERMFENFIAFPKPVIWPDYIAGSMTAFNRATVKDSYFALMTDRLSQYRGLAHVSIPYKDHHHPQFLAADLLKLAF